MAESKEELKSPLKVKEESEKAGLKLSIQKTKIVASGAITWWQIDGETMDMVTDFIFEGLPLTKDRTIGPSKTFMLIMGTAAMKWKDACSLEEKLWPT